MFGLGLEPVILVVLVLIAFVSGIGITTIGPGGIFVTIALYALTPLPSSTVAGTAHATFIATGLIGTIAYTRSGEMTAGTARAIAIILSLTSIAGALTGAYANPFVSRPLFGLLLGLAAIVTGLVILVRERRDVPAVHTVDPHTRHGQLQLGLVGFALGFAAGLLGVGGPVLAVPALVLLGVPMLVAVAVAQVQSIFIAGFATTGYLLQDSVSLPLAVLVGIPLLAGVITGWKLAHHIDPNRLRTLLGLVLIIVGLTLAW